VKSGLGIIGALAMAIAACGGSGQATGATTPAPTGREAPPSNSAPPPTFEAELSPPPDEPLAMMTLFTDQMCACHDRACADGVNDHMMAWGQQMAKNAGDKIKPVSGEEAKQIAEVAERFSKCLTAIATAAMNGSAATP
jgi:hypothetical protein